ncbi:class F sortase [Tenggerimyces flavus]|uniref:Class F sortase n=1 Tax=Tenggerimyces flavus TaxID=1708749 RepID=A0ABV7Y362_9ACTN|nr:class F sortase [Tenggerimyces flavus]MBM7790938.1 sortase (surface protein transpeptidase) [Tenggerimyces flavus]
MRWLAGALVTLFLLSACNQPAPADVGPSPAATLANPATSTAGAPTPSSSPGGKVTGSDPAGKVELAGVRPQSVQIPAIGVRSALMSLKLDKSGELERPKEFARAGWYDGGPVPGATGPAVIAGHVDSKTGPAVFWRLRDLQPGDEVRVELSDKSTVKFRVAQVKAYPKRKFPTAAVYGPTPIPTLRLITCGGDWEREGGYRDNIVVYAELVS